ncbi:MAG: rod shape-determining protein MreD [Lachnospiraceae bacterium]|nr:rod shape-determining protein MreD [Lachnospiraceae bacterium]
MLSFLLTALSILVSFLLQTAVFPAVLPLHVFPNLLIIVTAANGFMKDENVGIIVGFFCGLIYEIFFGEIIGFYALLYMYIGFLNGKFSKVFYPEDIKLPLALITVSDLTLSLVSYVFLFLVWGKVDFPYYFIHVILPELIVTMIATLIFYPVILKMNEWLRRRRRMKEY